jgi:hypothetical protein
LAIAMIGGATADKSEGAVPNPEIHPFTSISAKEIEDNAASNPIVYDNVAVIGDLDLKQNEYK